MHCSITHPLLSSVSVRLRFLSELFCPSHYHQLKRFTECYNFSRKLYHLKSLFTFFPMGMCEVNERETMCSIEIPTQLFGVELTLKNSAADDEQISLNGSTEISVPGYARCSFFLSQQ